MLMRIGVCLNIKDALIKKVSSLTGMGTHWFWRADPSLVHIEDMIGAQQSATQSGHLQKRTIKPPS